VVALVGSGIGASLIRLPTLASLWETSYGKTIIVKIGLLAFALLLAGGNFSRTKPRLEATASRPEVGTAAALLLRRLVSGEVLLVTGALFAAAILSGLPPPPKALANLGKAAATVGPGPVTAVAKH